MENTKIAQNCLESLKFTDQALTELLNRNEYTDAVYRTDFLDILKALIRSKFRFKSNFILSKKKLLRCNFWSILFNKKICSHGNLMAESAKAVITKLSSVGNVESVQNTKSLDKQKPAMRYNRAVSLPYDLGKDLSASEHQKSFTFQWKLPIKQLKFSFHISQTKRSTFYQTSCCRQMIKISVGVKIKRISFRIRITI